MMNLRMEVLIAKLIPTLSVLINLSVANPVHPRHSVLQSEEAPTENCEIIVTDVELDEFNFARTGLTQIWYRWPNNTVVYNMDTPPFEQSDKDLVERSLKQIEDVTCVKFVKRTDEDYFVNLTANSGCSSQVGYQKGFQIGPQRLNLSKGCLYTGTIIHEFLHTLGFYHMQSASNRDDYITVKWENVEKGKEHNFNKYGTDLVTDFDIGYDLLSIMHYHAYAFSANQEPTIEPHDSAYNKVIGQRNGLSEKDIARINRMYNCS